MTKHHLYISLIAALITITPYTSYAKTSLECDSEKTIASHIHKMMLDGANLNQVLSLFSDNDSAKAIARSLYTNIKNIDNEGDAIRVGLVICKLRKDM